MSGSELDEEDSGSEEPEENMGIYFHALASNIVQYQIICIELCAYKNIHCILSTPGIKRWVEAGQHIFIQSFTIP